MSVTILLGGLLPSLSQAMASPKAGGLAEICSATGATVLMLSGHLANADPDTSAPDAPSMKCPYCALHHGAPALPASLLPWMPALALRFEVPQRFLQSPRPLFAWAAPLARAPPVKV
ncbi:DUF2946 domain-containing protein [Roseateles sp. SL47]|uniref:DUF2946 domain-containing protein n=1 Tax=Roseateles sp. SL47 TaxID=2995138 RepID=UPI0022706EC8|nr:DUF2946 domain-containing protein [Roseateles sp. SL47]WAC72019.1 DUF2946 domain-containing protein [Roseateles sp. SL47]